MTVNTRAPGSPSLRAVQWAFGAGVLSTGVHYTHNFLYAPDYPPVPLFPSDLAYQVGIVAFWPTLTLLGLWGVVQYARGRVGRAVPALALWSMLGTTSPGHFIGGEVPDIPAYAMFTISTDLATGVVMLVLLAQAARSQTPTRSVRTAA